MPISLVTSTMGIRRQQYVSIMTDEVYVMPDPLKCFGKVDIRDDVAACLLSTNYKSPPWVVEIIGKHNGKNG